MDLTKSVESREIDQEIFYNVDINPSYRLDTGIYIHVSLYYIIGIFCSYVGLCSKWKSSYQIKSLNLKQISI